MEGEGTRRRELLLSLGGGYGALAGCIPRSGVSRSNAAGTGSESVEGYRAADCEPGHEAGDAACRQVFDDRKVLTQFDASGTIFPVLIDYPCGWTAGLTAFDDRIQLNATRSEIGDADGYVDVQVRAYFDPVEASIIEDIRSDGDYVDVEYTYGDETRTGLVSSRDSAQFGTVGHAAIPIGAQFVHLELVSTMKGTECTLEPRPDWWAVHDMLTTITGNPESTWRDEVSGFTPPASVSVSDQRVVGSYPAIVVDSVDLPEGGFLVVQRASDMSILGASTYLGSAEHQNIRVTLDEALPEGSTELIVTVYRDENGNNFFESAADSPYTVAGSPVTDRAVATNQSPSTSQTSTRTTTTAFPTTPSTTTETTTSTTTTTTTTTTRMDQGTSGGDGPGMGLMTALAALAGLLYVAISRGDEA